MAVASAVEKGFVGTFRRYARSEVQAVQAEVGKFLSKDELAAGENALGRATGKAFRGIMNAVKNPEAAVAAIGTGSGAVGGAIVGGIMTGGSADGMMHGAKVGMEILGGAGIGGAGIMMLGDGSMNTYAKLLTAFPVIGAGAGLVFGGFGAAPVHETMRIATAIGVGATTVTTAIKGVADVFSRWGSRLFT